jgi:hypothetical protein
MMRDDTMLTRRDWLVRAAGAIGGGAALAALLPATSGAMMKPAAITVYKDPSCGCCTKWVEHLRASGFAPDVHDRTDMDALKESLGVPAALRSCHTAVAGRYVVEGHVPAADLRKLLATSPAKVVGLAVPGMPAGSPGMEMGGRADRYEVIAFGTKGTTSVFARH